jgi:hypothetical protein
MAAAACPCGLGRRVLTVIVFAQETEAVQEIEIPDWLKAQVCECRGVRRCSTLRR